MDLATRGYRPPGRTWTARSTRLTAAGIPAERIYLDKKSGATTDRPGLRSALARPSDDVMVVRTLDRLGRTVRDALNLIHELAERGVGSAT